MVSDLAFGTLSDGGILRLSDSWPDTIQIANELLCSAADGMASHDSIAVSGVIDTIGALSSMTWTKVTFCVENGTATYALQQEGDDFMADRWTGRLVGEGE